jgi:hypothetical protein
LCRLFGFHLGKCHKGNVFFNWNFQSVFNKFYLHHQPPTNFWFYCFLFFLSLNSCFFQF